MSNVTIFENVEFGSVRTVEQNGDVWFVAKDVADILDYCVVNELDIKDVFDERYGKVKSYPSKAWMGVYNLSLDELF